MAFPRTPGGLFPLTTAPTGRNAGGQYPLPAVLSDAIRSLAPTAYWKLDEASGNLADTMSGGYTATVTGSPTYGAAAPSPIGRGVTWSGSGQFGTASTSFPNPSTGLSVLTFMSTTSTAASGRFMNARGAGGTGQAGHGLLVHSDHTLLWKVFQADGTDHIYVFGGAMNDGNWHLAAGTFDGTTATVWKDTVATTSTTRSGAWGKSSTAALRIANMNGGSLFAGSLAHQAVFIDRVLTGAEIRWLYSIAFGG